MTDQEFSPLTVQLAKGLADRIPDKRKAAALEVERYRFSAEAELCICCGISAAPASQRALQCRSRVVDGYHGAALWRGVVWCGSVWCGSVVW